MHFEYISETVSKALMQVQLDEKVPVIFGLLTCLTLEQAWKRSGTGPAAHNHGLDWAHAALHMMESPLPHASFGVDQPESGAKKRKV